MSVVRVREHVNPLAKKYQTAVTPPDWSQIYDRVDRPLHLDLGCGKGRFALSMAQQALDWNFLGLEIREPLVEQANVWRDELELTNLHYVFCNVNNSFRPLLASLPRGVLQRITIQFPDPWFKRRHQKRRVVQPELVADMAEWMAPNGMIFVQSDVLEVAAEICDRIAEHPAFERQTPDWLADNPLPIRTEREQSTLEQGLPVYRAIFHLKPRMATTSAV